MQPVFKPGKNLAMKVPAGKFTETVSFYKNVLGFKEVEANSPDDIDSVSFQFGNKILWIDKVQGINKAEIWLEIITNDFALASTYFEEEHINRCDHVEPLP